MKRTISKRLSALLLTLVLLLGAWPVTASAATTTPVDTALKESLAQELAGLTNPEFGSEWVILGLARSGRLDKSDKLFDDYYKNVVTYVNKQAAKVNKNGALHPVKCTENSRLIIALSALGRDVTKVGNWSLVEPYEDFDWISGQGLNSVVFALIALDAAQYETRAGNTRQRCLSYLLNRQLPDGGWAYAEDAKTGDPDMTAMTLQALAGYRDQEAVRIAVSQGVECLSNLQNKDGSYASYDTVNSESAAQVIVACAALGIDAHTDARFVKGGVSPVDSLLSFYDSDARAFHHVMKDKFGEPTDVDGMATEQAVYAMTAYQRLKNGKASLYDMSDVKQDCADGGHSFGEWTETPATCTQPGTKTRVCSVCGRSEIQEIAPALGHKLGTAYDMSDEYHWLTCSVCGSREQKELHLYGGDQCTVCGYHKLGGRIEITSLTAVPAALQSQYDSLSALEDAMLTAAKKVSSDCTPEKSQLLHVALMIPSTADGKTVWKQAEKSNFPVNGKIQVLLPYPDGTDANSYDFVVTHLLTSEDFGKTFGSMESPKVKKTADGLLVTITGTYLSPVMISWHTPTPSIIDKVVDPVVDRVVNGVKTGDMGVIVWLVAMPAAALTAVVMICRKRRGR